MQYPVPQFTDVEDRIIAGLSFKQFGLILAAGIMTFFVYAVSKNVYATVMVGVFFGIPGLALTFGRLNGRPLYSSTGSFVRFLIGPKLYVFHKQVYQSIVEHKDVKIHEAAPKSTKAETAVKIKELSYLLQQQASEEATLIARIQENKQSK